MQNDNTSSTVVKLQISAQIATSLEALRVAMGWTQTEFSKKMDVSFGAISGYLNDKNDKVPSLEFLVSLCRLEDFKKRGLDLSIDALLSPDFDPVSLIKKREGSVASSSKHLYHKDFLGTYLCYFFDQSKPLAEQDHKASRELRYGVLCVYDDYVGLSGDAVIRVIGVFFKEKEYGIAKGIKEELERLQLDETASENVSERNKKIHDVFLHYRDKYVGQVEFGVQHTFISLESEVINDHALIILYAPHKRSDNEYIGGIGSVCSVAHGRSHMPTAQKIILSRYEITCSREEIAEYLSMSNAPIASSTEVEALSELCKKLYEEKNTANQLLDDSDKNAILTHRINQLIRNYIEKNICCVGSVSDSEDMQVYSLIKDSMQQ